MDVCVVSVQATFVVYYCNQNLEVKERNHLILTASSLDRLGTWILDTRSNVEY